MDTSALGTIPTNCDVVFLALPLFKTIGKVENIRKAQQTLKRTTLHDPLLLVSIKSKFIGKVILGDRD